MDTITIPRREIGEFLAGVEQVSAATKSKDFRVIYALKRTRDALRAEVDAIEAAQQSSPEFVAYEQARIALCRDYAVMENGEPKMQTLQDGREVFVMDEARSAEFRTALQALRAEHRGAIDAEDARRRGLAEFLREPCEVPVHRIQVGALTLETYTAQQLTWIMPMLSDADEVGGRGAA